MSKTGHYVWDPDAPSSVTGKKGAFVKVSDKPGRLRKQIYWPKACEHSGYYSESLDTHFQSKDHKRQVMEEQGVSEAV
jgi:hypothetical protein